MSSSSGGLIETITKVKDLASVALLKTKITFENLKINYTYRNIGKKYYEQKSTLLTDEGIEDLVVKIDDSRTNISSIKTKIKNINTTKTS